MGLKEVMESAFSFLRTRSQLEERMAQYVIREHHRGRSLNDILEDPYLTNRLSHEQVDRLLDRPEVVHALGDDMIGEVRDERPAGTPS